MKKIRESHIYIYIYIALALVLGCFINNFVTTNEGVLANEEDAPRVDVGIELKIKKTDPEGKPLKGVKFKLHNGTYETDEKGEVSIPTYKHPDGFAALIEEGQVIEGAEYEAKAINLNIKERCYDGACFHGEIKGNDFITYNKLKTEIESNGKTIGMALELGNDKGDGGNWLKFTDSKYKDVYGRPRVFYIAKKPITNDVSWDDLFNAGVVYGLDTVGKEGNVLSGVTGVKAGYKPKFVEIDGKKYIVRLLQGRTNFNVDKNKAKVYGQYVGIGSEWNRTILPITQEYRYGSDTINDENWRDSPFTEGVGEDYSKREYKVQLANYNWFGDLTLGAYDSYKYNGVYQSRAQYQGQYNWCQEFSYSASYRAYRGGGNTHYGAAGSSYYSSSGSYSFLGFRPVLEEVPLEYDGIIFEGEVSGNELGITYNKVLEDIKLNIKGSAIQVLRTSEYTAAKKIDKLYKEELAKGGMWLKFTDYKYKDANGKPRTFYVAKKPLKKGLSWENLYTAGVIYGPDVINGNGKIKNILDSNKLKEANSWNGNKTLKSTSYKATFMQANGKKYIVRLLRGKSNYGESMYGKSSIYRSNSDNQFSEWNRVMLPITKDYRASNDTFEDNYLEPALREGASYGIPTNDYKVQLAKYNWFGDLTVGAYTSFSYKGENVNDDDGTGSNGQLSWCQEFSNSSERRAFRGSNGTNSGAAHSYDNNSSYYYNRMGFRPVLELID